MCSVLLEPGVEVASHFSHVNNCVLFQVKADGQEIQRYEVTDRSVVFYLNEVSIKYYKNSIIV